MKNLLYIFLGLLLLSSCATTKTSKAPSPTGNWDYTVTGTPEGEFSGVLTISEVDKTYSSKMASSAGDLVIDKYLYDKATKKMSGEFYYSGALVLFDVFFIVPYLFRPEGKLVKQVFVVECWKRNQASSNNNQYCGTHAPNF